MIPLKKYIIILTHIISTLKTHDECNWPNMITHAYGEFALPSRKGLGDHDSLKSPKITWLSPSTSPNFKESASIMYCDLLKDSCVCVHIKF